MTARRLATKYVEKPWGSDHLPPLFPDAHGQRIGEVWFDGPPGEHPALLVKYIFTSERLSIQVHPTDAQRHDLGLPSGKTECWYILDAEPDARLGLGTLAPLSGDALRAAALDGSIQRLMDWKPARPGDFFFVPAGTVHAIGAGITLVEVQQNVDVTYRLYDYGRPRELHLDDGVAVSVAEPYRRAAPNLAAVGAADLLDRWEAPFSLILRSHDAGDGATIGTAGQPGWFVPLTGTGTLNGQPWEAGECWLLDGQAALACTAPTRTLIATIP
ncbi:class I mannose-6-phosphate isomerase [Sphingobium sufflavum]|uniref:class I mannose-6-phosphate isomerase n=1 Tax=Sphingobium sufflavum TaxID=1129547 RepID=UPI001F410219|nr:class I mannose-6-phosphate isomerase [Sphingobium sufflavum]MCE7797293.1 class I mannose-6-phosphate isomerase [Sphingobium sufflavum]